jgi:hypothetical protein
MHIVQFKAYHLHASKEDEDKFYMVGLSDSEFNYNKYIILQKPYDLDDDEDPNAPSNGVFVECNGDVCFNCCKSAVLTKNHITFFVQDVKIKIDIRDVNVTELFLKYLNAILGDLLTVNENQE